MAPKKKATRRPRKAAPVPAAADNVRLGIWIPRQARREWKAAAAGLDCSMSALVVAAMSHYLGTREADRPRR